MKPRKTHGLSGTKEYFAWKDMLKRCYNENHYAYKNYGGRGIIVCDRWKFSIHEFIKDVGLSPIGKYDLDRMDNEGNYEPSNVRWVTRFEGNGNKRTVKKIEYNGESHSLAEWCRRLDKNYGVVLSRIKNHGYTFWQAVNSGRYEKKDLPNAN